MSSSSKSVAGDSRIGGEVGRRARKSRTFGVTSPRADRRVRPDHRAGEAVGEARPRHGGEIALAVRLPRAGRAVGAEAAAAGVSRSRLPLGVGLLPRILALVGHDGRDGVGVDALLRELGPRLPGRGAAAAERREAGGGEAGVVDQTGALGARHRLGDQPGMGLRGLATGAAAPVHPPGQHPAQHLGGGAVAVEVVQGHPLQPRGGDGRLGSCLPCGACLPLGSSVVTTIV